MELEKFEVISNQVAIKIKNGETELTVFSPLELAVNGLVTELKNKLVIKEVSDITEEDNEKYKKTRTGINKALGFVKERRLEITRSLDTLKGTFTQREKDIVKELSEYGDNLKEVLDNKKIYDEEEAIKLLVPERKNKVELAGLTFSEEEMLSTVDVFNALYSERMEAKLLKEKSDRETKEREEQIKKDAVEEFKKEQVVEPIVEQIDSAKKEVLPLDVEFEKETIKQLTKEQARKLVNFNSETDTEVEKNGLVVIYRVLIKYKK